MKSLIASIIIILSVSCQSRSGQRITRKTTIKTDSVVSIKPIYKKVRAQALMLTSDGHNYKPLTGVTSLVVDTIFQVGDTVMQSDTYFVIK